MKTKTVLMLLIIILIIFIIYIKGFYKYNIIDMQFNTIGTLIDNQIQNSGVLGRNFNRNKEHITRKLSLNYNLTSNVKLYIGIAYLFRKDDSQKLIGNLSPLLLPGTYSGEKIADSCYHLKENSISKVMRQEKMLICINGKFIYRVSLKTEGNGFDKDNVNSTINIEKYAKLVDKEIVNANYIFKLLPHSSYISDSIIQFTPKGI